MNIDRQTPRRQQQQQQPPPPETFKKGINVRQRHKTLITTSSGPNQQQHHHGVPLASTARLNNRYIRSLTYCMNIDRQTPRRQQQQQQPPPPPELFKGRFNVRIQSLTQANKSNSTAQKNNHENNNGTQTSLCIDTHRSIAM